MATAADYDPIAYDDMTPEDQYRYDVAAEYAQDEIDAALYRDDE